MAVRCSRLSDQSVPTRAQPRKALCSCTSLSSQDWPSIVGTLESTCIPVLSPKGSALPTTTPPAYRWPLQTNHVVMPLLSVRQLHGHLSPMSKPAHTATHPHNLPRHICPMPHPWPTRTFHLQPMVAFCRLIR